MHFFGLAQFLIENVKRRSQRLADSIWLIDTGQIPAATGEIMSSQTCAMASHCCQIDPRPISGFSIGILYRDSLSVLSLFTFCLLGQCQQLNRRHLMGFWRGFSWRFSALTAESCGLRLQNPVASPWASSIIKDSSSEIRATTGMWYSPTTELVFKMKWTRLNSIEFLGAIEFMWVETAVALEAMGHWGVLAATLWRWHHPWKLIDELLLQFKIERHRSITLNFFSNKFFFFFEVCIYNWRVFVAVVVFVFEIVITVAFHALLNGSVAKSAGFDSLISTNWMAIKQ